MPKYGDFSYKLVRTETEKCGIEKIIKELDNDALLLLSDKVREIGCLEFDGKLPESLIPMLNEAIAFAVNTYLNEFPETEYHFPFGRPLLPVSLEIEREYYIINFDTSAAIAYKGSRAGTVAYDVSTIYHVDSKMDELEKRQGKDNKFVGLLDAAEHRTRILSTANSVCARALITPGSTLERITKQMAYIAIHEAVHLVTMPPIMKRGLEYCNSESVWISIEKDGKKRLNISRLDTLSIKDFLKRDEFTNAREIAGYSLGSVVFKMFMDYKGTPAAIAPTEFTGANDFYITKSDEIVSKAGGLLRRCNELVQEEIDIQLKVLETLKKS